MNTAVTEAKVGMLSESQPDIQVKNKNGEGVCLCDAGQKPTDAKGNREIELD